MKVTIKVLKGKDFFLDVSPTTTILEVKHQIEKSQKIPVASQKLLLLGRTLCDDQFIASYPNIQDGSRLNLIVMKPDSLKDVIHRSFRRYYNDQQAERLTEEFMLDIDKKIAFFSLDDIERIASSILEPQES